MSSLPETIKVLQIQPDKTLELVQIPFASQDLIQNLPEDQILIRVRAVGLNPTDWGHVMGPLHAPGNISGCESAGDVVKVGSAVQHLKVGDRAAGFTFGGSQTDNGSYSEYVRCVAAVCFKVPDSMTYEEAAAFPVVHLTAMQALYVRLGVPKQFSPNVNENPNRQSILIWGGSTATGHHAVQLAALAGMRVFVTASPEVHNELKTLGAEACFDYHAGADVTKQVLEATGGEGVDFGLDCIVQRGSTDATVDSISARHGGRIITLRPISAATQNRRKDVKIELILAHTLMGLPVNFGRIIEFPAMPEDKSASLEYVTEILPRILEGWKKGQGSPKIRPQRLRHMPGGLENIYKGMELMRDGKYGREKLVYTIA